MQKVTFWDARGNLLQYKRRPFGMQKMAFGSEKTHVFMPGTCISGI